MAVETFTADKSGKLVIVKDPNAVLDYTFDWTGWLAAAADPDDTLTGVVFSLSGSDVGAGQAQVMASSFDNTKATAWVSAGRVGETVALTCHITTAGGRQDDRTVYLKVKER